MLIPQLLWGGCASDCSHCKKNLYCIKKRLLLVQSVPVHCLLSLPCGFLGRSLCPLCSYPKVPEYCDEASPEPSLLRVKRPNSVSLSSQGRFSNPRIIFMALLWNLPSVLIFSELWGPELDTELQAQPNKRWEEWDAHRFASRARHSSALTKTAPQRGVTCSKHSVWGLARSCQMLNEDVPHRQALLGEKPSASLAQQHWCLHPAGQVLGVSKCPSSS